MTQQFDVHLYVTVRVKFGGIEAETHEDALAEARRRYGRYSGGEDLFGLTAVAQQEGIILICDTEGGVEDAVVDVVGDEEYAQTRTYSTDGQVASVLARVW